MRLIEVTFNPNHLFVDDGELQSKSVRQTKGVVQRDRLSPYLFAMFMDDLARTIGTENETQAIMHAVDLTLAVSSREKLQQQLNTLESWCNADERKVNVQETCIMNLLAMVSREKLIAHSSKYMGKPVCLVDDFCYLGVTLQSTLCFAKRIRDQSELQREYSI